MRDVHEITAGLGRRDNMPPSDIIRLAFDPRHDHLTAYSFDANPSGVQSDYAWYDDTRPEQRLRRGLGGAHHDHARGMERGVPHSVLPDAFPRPNGERMVWGFNVRRDIFKRGENSLWVPTPRGTQGLVSRMGHLIFDEPFTPPRRLELLPYTLAREVDVAAAPADRSATVGFDARVGLGTSATVSATVNPDFAQVEQDPAVLNLTVFETFFQKNARSFSRTARRSCCRTTSFLSSTRDESASRRGAFPS